MESDVRKGLAWEWQAMDGAMTKAPLGGKGTGPNPTERGKAGTKRSILVEGGGGPLSVAAAGANVHDTKLLRATLETAVVERPEPTPQQPQNMCLGRGEDNGDSCS